MEIYDQIITKFRLCAAKPSLYKKFVFALEDLQDNPEKLLEVVNYLEMHKGKYEDFNFHTWVDSENFSTVLLLQLIPSEEIRKYMTSEAKDFANFFEIRKNENY